MRTSGVLTKKQVENYLRSAKKAGYANVTVEGTLESDGKKTVKVIAHDDTADESLTTKSRNGRTDEVEDWLAKHAS